MKRLSTAAWLAAAALLILVLLRRRPPPLAGDARWADSPSGDDTGSLQPANGGLPDIGKRALH